MLAELGLISWKHGLVQDCPLLRSGWLVHPALEGDDVNLSRGWAARGATVTLGWSWATSARAGQAGGTPRRSFAGRSVCANSLARRFSQSPAAPLAPVELDLLCEQRMSLSGQGRRARLRLLLLLLGGSSGRSASQPRRPSWAVGSAVCCQPGLGCVSEKLS